MSGASLGAFRASVGLAFALSAGLLLYPSSGISELQLKLTGDPLAWRVPLAGLEWVRPWPEPWMTVAVAGLLVAGILLMLGVASRFMALACCLLWTHVWLCDVTSFNNHYYLLSLLALLLSVMPCGRRLSVDALILRRRGGPDRPQVPSWPVQLLRAQLGIVYFYGGITKITADYVLRGEPVRYFLDRARILTDLEGTLSRERLESLHAILTAEATVRFISWSGLFFDLAVLPLLLWRRTRLAAVLLAFAFHGFNHFVLFSDIGVFPLLGALSTLVFLDFDWPANLWRRLRRLPARIAPADPRPSPAAHSDSVVTGVTAVTGALVAAWIVVQVLLPMRPWIIPGDADLGAEGTLFSWRMKNSVRARDLHSVIVRDPGLVTDGSDGPGVDWSALPGPRMLLRHVPASDVPWNELPPIVIVREPLIGERIFVNPYSPLVQDGTFASVASISTEWVAAGGGQPDIAPTVDLVEAVAAMERATSGTDAAAPVRRVLERLGARLAEPGGPTENDRFARDRRVRQALVALLSVDGIRDAVLGALERSEPFAAWGGRRSEMPFAVIRDPSLEMRDGAFREIRREGLQPFWPGSEMVVVDLRLLDTSDQARLALATPMLMPDGDITFLWNMAADSITRERANWVAVYPQCLQLYSRRVADLWQEQHGRRPVVQGRFYVRVNRGEPILLTDGIADLASEPVRRLTHAPWIVPPSDYPPPATIPAWY